VRRVPLRFCLQARNGLMMPCPRVPEIQTVHRILGPFASEPIGPPPQPIGNFKKSLSPAQQFSESAFHEINAEIADLRKAVVGEEEAGGIGATERQISPVERF